MPALPGLVEAGKVADIYLQSPTEARGPRRPRSRGGGGCPRSRLPDEIGLIYAYIFSRSADGTVIYTLLSRTLSVLEAPVKVSSASCQPWAASRAGFK